MFKIVSICDLKEKKKKNLLSDPSTPALEMSSRPAEQESAGKGFQRQAHMSFKLCPFHYLCALRKSKSNHPKSHVSSTVKGK